MPTSDAGFFGGQEACSHPHGLATHDKGSRQAAPITDPASGNDRNLDSIEYLGQKGEGADMSGVATTFRALCDDDVGTVLYDTDSLFRVADYRHHHCTCFMEAVHHKTR